MRLQILSRLSCVQRTRDVPNRVPNNPQRNPNPERVEEDQVHPEVHEVACIKVDITDEPLGAESHESYRYC